MAGLYAGPSYLQLNDVWERSISVVRPLLLRNYLLVLSGSVLMICVRCFTKQLEFKPKRNFSSVPYRRSFENAIFEMDSHLELRIYLFDLIYKTKRLDNIL